MGICGDAMGLSSGRLRLVREPPDSPEADSEPGFRRMLIEDGKLRGTGRETRRAVRVLSSSAWLTDGL